MSTLHHSNFVGNILFVRRMSSRIRKEDFEKFRVVRFIIASRVQAVILISYSLHERRARPRFTITSYELFDNQIFPPSSTLSSGGTRAEGCRSFGPFTMISLFYGGCVRRPLGIPCKRAMKAISTRPLSRHVVKINPSFEFHPRNIFLHSSLPLSLAIHD